MHLQFFIIGLSSLHWIWHWPIYFLRSSKIVNFTFLYILFRWSYAFLIFYIISYVAWVSLPFKCILSAWVFLYFSKTYEFSALVIPPWNWVPVLSDINSFRRKGVIWNSFRYNIYKKKVFADGMCESNECSRNFENDSFMKIWYCVQLVLFEVAVVFGCTVFCRPEGLQW